LTNVPATFQAYINETLKGLLDVTCVTYMDDICIYSDSVEEHAEHVREILTRLRKAGLYVKLSKCEFDKQEIAFLGYVIGVYDMRMDNAKVKTITD
jgi:Reverse transcriptase (RNA-dependent DNA polymerase)